MSYGHEYSYLYQIFNSRHLFQNYNPILRNVTQENNDTQKYLILSIANYKKSKAEIFLHKNIYTQPTPAYG